MNERKKILTYTFIYAGAILIFFAWLFAFLKNNEKIHYNFDCESLGITVIGIVAFLVLVFVEDSFYFGVILTFAPFAFSRSFDAVSLPPTLYLLAVLSILGIALHLIIYPPQIKKGTYFYSLLVFCVGMCLGGLIKAKSFWQSFGFSCGISVLIMFVYMFIVTYLEKHEFSEIAHIFMALSIMLVIQTFAYQIVLYRDAIFIDKAAKYGWGGTNNLALMQLLCLPFLIYFTINSKTIVAPFATAAVAFDCVSIVLNYSRGASFVLVMILPVCLIYAFIKSKTKLAFILYYLSMFFILVTSFFILRMKYESLFGDIFNNLFAFDITSLNGRRFVYEKILELSKTNLIFGKGLLSTLDPEVAAQFGEEYWFWGHNTFIHCLYISGIFGVLCLCYHLYNKYLYLLKNPNVKKMTILLGLLASGLYGLMDISYYYIIYMVVMIVLMGLVEYEINTFDEDITYEI